MNRAVTLNCPGALSYGGYQANSSSIRFQVDYLYATPHLYLPYPKAAEATFKIL
jgi:hypothetical protein